MEQKYLSLKQVAKRLGLSKSSVYSLLRREDFPKRVIFGHSYRLSVDDVDNWAKAQTEKREA